MKVHELLRQNKSEYLGYLKGTIVELLMKNPETPHQVRDNIIKIQEYFDLLFELYQLDVLPVD